MVEPSALQISMRFLFQIIAGLLLADVFKQAVDLLNVSRAASNVRLVLAAATFLTRLVVDTYIYYEGGDLPPASTGEYAVRILLLLIDLAAFALAYDIVHQLSATEPFGPTEVLPLVRARRMLIGMAAIEGIHTLWGLIEALREVYQGNSLGSVLLGSTGGTVIGRWLLLSSVFALLPLPIIARMRGNTAPSTERASWIVMVFSFASAITYALVMQDYYVGRMKP
jgi:hypothetical protein